MKSGYPSIMVVGSINVDVTSHVRTFPSPGETVSAHRLTRQLGGKGANQAVAAARLAGFSRLVGALGDDEEGSWALRELREAGVEVSGVSREAAATWVAIVTVDSAGENTIVVHAGANAAVEVPGQISPDEVVLCQLEIPIGAVVATAQRHAGFFALNAAPACPLPETLVRRCDLIVVNEYEHDRLPELADARQVAVTYGARGAAIYREGELVVSVPARPAKVVNSLGAGDAFTAALTICLAAGHRPHEPLAAACAVGAAAVEDPRSQPRLDPLGHYLPVT
jgi:ribokinase